jgi:hypothetical protein
MALYAVFGNKSLELVSFECKACKSGLLLSFRSCWLDFAKYISDHRLKVPSWEEICASVKVDSVVKQAGRIMFTFFISHVYLEKHRGDLSLQVV